MSAVTPFLIWLFCVGLAALVIGIAIKSTWTEGFDSIMSNPAIRITACPKGSTTIITSEGDTNCCNGDSVNNKCNGETVCSLSPSKPGGLMSCSDWVKKEWSARSSRFCTGGMPNYFGTLSRKNTAPEGCSKSPCTEDGSQPTDSTQPMCKIYHTSDEEYSRPDSCFNMRAKEKMVCPTSDAAKNILNGGLNLPVLLSCSYSVASSLTPIQCYDSNRVRVYLNARDPALAKSFMDSPGSDKNVLLCPASKAYYVDKTMSEADMLKYRKY